MHGRLKVRTTEEEKERKKKEQALKVKAYRAAMTKIQAKRQNEEFDDSMLLLTTQILLRNPDVSTLWNIRRQCVEQKAKNAITEEDKESLQAVYDAELGLTEQCLMVNPKSYGGWHHRCWTLEHCPEANWTREMQLCNKYLKLDERNFHTWDYRRYVASKAGVAKEDELNYCTDKIKVNFSNYSSWHYRSLLLPALYPYEGEALPKRPMSETKLKEELEMVLTAAFTDPNDSSAWFYQRWLLGSSRPELEICAFRCDAEKAVLAFTKPPNEANFKVVLCEGSNRIELSDWSSVKLNAADTVWLAKMPANHGLSFVEANAYQLEVDIPTLSGQKLPLRLYANCGYYFKPPNRSFAYTPAVLAELQSQLESCNSLLEYEPDSKWTLLTAALLMRAIDSEQYHSKSLEYLEKLQKLDFLREGYYKDLSSKWIMEKVLTDSSNGIPKQLNLSEETHLTSICYGQYLSIVDEVVLSAELEKSFGSKLKTYKALKL